MAAIASPADWPRLLGESRNGVSDEAIAAKWPGNTPEVVWRREVGDGFAGPVVAGGKLILFHRLGDRETVECLDAASGRKVWMADYATSFRDNFGLDEDPRAAPTIGAQGVLHCLDFRTGKKRWSVDTHREFGVKKGFFGAAGAPLVEDGQVLLNVGGPGGAGLVALDAAGGKLVWKATDDQAGYSSPVTATVGGERRAIFFTRHGLVDLDPADGRVRHHMRWRSRSNASVNAAVPLVIGDLLFLSTSYGKGDGAPERLWASDDVHSNHYAISVHKDGYLYGFHGRQEFGQSLRSVELKTGKVAWETGEFRAGTVMLAGGRLLVLSESGELVKAPATPEGFRPDARAKILDPVLRTYPALSDGLLFARNEK
ncbi:MAG: PQQ-binding-like beta-propeller repeat protein, partial [bacterium]|nr:PQQ-binding-like beta-propeller repeat protein [bacterium]